MYKKNPRFNYICNIYKYFLNRDKEIRNACEGYVLRQSEIFALLSLWDKPE